MANLDLNNIDVIVIGAGNAAANAAVTAQVNGAKVLILEAAPVDDRGGNSAFTGGALRFPYSSLEDLEPLVVDITDEERKTVDVGVYDEDKYFDDLFRMSDYRCNADMAEILVRQSHESLVRMREYGIRFALNLRRQSYKVDGKHKIWGGVAACIWGGGEQLVESWHKILEDRQIPVVYQAPAWELMYDGDKVHGVVFKHDNAFHKVQAKAVILACGSYESNPEMRVRYLGPGWELARVRGTRYNMGAGLTMAMDIGAMTAGQWSACHSVQWDINAPEYGDITMGDLFQKHNYPFTILINAKGERFLDEGLDFHSYTYARYGAEVLKQPGQMAWQVLDQKVVHLLRDEYRVNRVTKATANTLEELAPKLEGVDPKQFLKTAHEFNAAVQDDVPFDPVVHDGKGTKGLAINKTNWANKLDTPPFEAYCVTTGVTFAFGGLKVTTEAEVEDKWGHVIPGLYAAGEIVGGLYYNNYASGTGLVCGSTFGQLAGKGAAAFAKS
ncbi:MAG: FAD-dependent tricarballylate dehydrogenase TcuA [Rhodospirillales bacterium]